MYQPPADWWMQLGKYVRGETDTNPLTGEQDAKPSDRPCQHTAPEAKIVAAESWPADGE